MALIVLSFDGVTNTEFEKMAADAKTYPNIAAFFAKSLYSGPIYSTFVSNTYPIHTSINTGKHPADHGIISNLLEEGPDYEVWAQEAALIKSKTILEAATEKGLDTAAILWPVTCGAKIKWNFPEVHLLPGQKRLIQHLRHGSKWLQIRALRRFGHKLKGINQPFLDDFVSAVAADLISRKHPDLTLVHLLAYDAIRHSVGMAPPLDAARASLDESLGRIMAAKRPGDAVLIFSDHGHIDIKHNINLAPIYGDGLYEQCGGSAFFNEDIKDIKEQEWFARFLTEEEMTRSGYKGRAVMGAAAKPGYSLSRGRYMANHGYPIDYPDYQVFYAAWGLARGIDNLPFDDIRNVTAIIQRELELDM